jgi:hypothetical protein
MLAAVAVSHHRDRHPLTALAMAETSGHLAQAPPGEPDEPHLDYPVRPSGDTDRNAREDTELARLRRNYSRASSYRPQGSSTASKRPTTLLGRFTYTVSKFWRHQVSITVEHSTCRDHLGTFLRALCSPHVLQIDSAICVLPDWGSGSPFPKRKCTKSSGIFTALFHHIHLQSSVY